MVSGLMVAVRPARAAQQAVAPIYRLTPASELSVETTKSGIFSPFGHTHRIRAQVFQGTITYTAAHPESSSVAVRLPTDGLIVVSDDTSEQRKVGANMRDDVLEVGQYPEMTFQSTAVRPDGDVLHITGDLTMHGQTHEVTMDARVAVTADTLRGHARFEAKQTAWGMKPYSTAVGTVKVGDTVKFDITLVAVREP